VHYVAEEIERHVITGLEPAILKAAATGATRAAGWGTWQAQERRRRNRVRKLLAGIEATGHDGGTDTEHVTEETLAEVGEYLQSPQFVHIAHSLASVIVVENAGKKTDQAIEALKAEMSASLKSAVTGYVDENAVDCIFAALLHAVTVETSHVKGSSDRLPARVQAEAVKLIANIAAASARNTTLLNAFTEQVAFVAFENAMREQVRALHGTMRLPHAGTTRQVTYDRLFIPARLTPPRSEGRPEHGNETISVVDLIKNSTRCVILGDPGGGKSTLALKLAYDIASDQIPGSPARVPLLVVLRDYAASTRGAHRVSIVEYLEAICTSPYSVSPPPQSIEYLLLNGRALVIFDGLDELLDTSLRRDVVQAVEGFAYRYPTTQIVVTSRRIGYEEASLDSDLFPLVTLKELSTRQVAEYAEKWFNLDEGEPVAERQRLTQTFLSDSDFVADLRINPLMLSLMCGIYATENYIPRNRPEVYEKCALLLFERWDKQRGIEVPLAFQAHLHAAMRSLALHMYSQERPQLGRAELVRFIKDYLLAKRFDDADVAESAAEQFIDFCKGRAWVLTDVGSDRYGFTHRTFLEYFSASQLVRLHTGPDPLFKALYNHLCAQEWDVVAQLAVQILGRSVEDGADDFLKLAVEAAGHEVDASRTNLLLFSSRALQFIVPRPDVLRSIVIECMRLLAETPVRGLSDPDVRLEVPSPPAVYLLGSSTELRSAIARLLRDEIRNYLDHDCKREQILAYAVLPWIFSDALADASISTNMPYWRKWARENEKIFSEFLDSARARYYWIDILRLYRRQSSVKEVLVNHGPAALYEYQVAGYGLYAPIAYQLLSNLSEGIIVLGLQPRMGPKAVRKVISDLTDLLPDIPPPWLPFRRRYRILSNVVDIRLNTNSKKRLKIPDELTLFLALPLVELFARFYPSMRHRSADISVNDSLQSIFAARMGVGSLDNALSALNEADISDRAREVLRRWAAGEIDFVKPSPRRRRSPDDG
jgi:hypothetical protein